MMTVHAGGTFLVCKHAVPLMGRPGSIVNIASTAALTANHHNAPYGAAKGAIISFSRQLARDVAPDIRVNVVAPGRVRTAMTEPLMEQRGAGDIEAGARAFGQASLLQPRRRARRAGGADLLPALRRRQLHHRDPAGGGRRRDRAVSKET